MRHQSFSLGFGLAVWSSNIVSSVGTWSLQSGRGFLSPDVESRVRTWSIYFRVKSLDLESGLGLGVWSAGLEFRLGVGGPHFDFTGQTWESAFGVPTWSL